MQNNLEIVKLLICSGSIIEPSLKYAINYKLYNIVNDLEEALKIVFDNNDYYLINLINSYIINLTNR